MLKALFIRIVLSVSIITSVLCDFNLLLLHTNDLHSRFKEVNQDIARCQLQSKKCFGGFARVRAAVDNYKKEAKKKGTPALYLDAGDVFHENVYYQEYKWKLAVKMMNLLRPDAMSLGNHEFDDGIQGLAPFVKRLEVPLVCCNIDTSEVSELQVPKQLLPSKVFEFGNTKVGVVGYLTRNIPSNHLGNVKLFDEIESLRKETERLKKEGVNIIIALGHSGYRKDKQIAEEVEEVDLVVGGHSHAFLYAKGKSQESQISGKYPTIITRKGSLKRVPVVQAFYGTKYLGRLELVFDDDGNLKSHKGSPILLRGNMKRDKEVLRALEPYSKQIILKYGRKIGRTEVLLSGRRTYCRTRECKIGNLITDAFVEYVNKKMQPTQGDPVQISLVLSKSIKGSLHPRSYGYMGDITLEDVIDVLPYGHSLVVLRLKGRVLRQALEASVDKYDSRNGGLLEASLLQVSGLRVQIDLHRERGSRVTSVKVTPGYQDLGDEEDYNVVMTDYLASKKDDFPMLVNLPRIIELPEDDKDYIAVAEYIEHHSPLIADDLKDEGRISIQG